LPKDGIALYPGEIRVILHKIIPAEKITDLSCEDIKIFARKEIVSPLAP
jgi:hypothetical protein